MARTKKVKPGISEATQQATRELAEELAESFDQLTIEKFGCLNPPASYTTPFGIRPLDAILGGGFSSSSIVAFSSTPETRIYQFH